MNTKPQIILLHSKHKEVPIVEIRFDYNFKIKEQVKKISGAKWSNSKKCWYIGKHEFELGTVFNLVKDFAYLDYSGLKETKKPQEKTAVAGNTKAYNANLLKEKVTSETKDKIALFKGWMLQKRYSKNTIKTYIHQIEIFFGYYWQMKPEELKNKDIEAFNSSFIIKNKLSITFQNQTVSALKLFYQHIQNKNLQVENIERPRKSARLPKVIGKKDLVVLFNCITNQKHKMAFETIYACGLRRSELIDLKLEHINRQTGLISIINAKGNKDRVIPISKRWLDKLIPYYREYKPLVYLIEGQYPGKSISETSLQKIFERKLIESKLNRHYTIHSLRHSIATHMLESGISLRFIQEFLGHKSSKTTEIYTHVSNDSLRNIKNPFDELEI